MASPVAPAVASDDRAGDAVAAAEAFLDRYVASDGRVVRRDEGGDTVSEGQAYAMLVSAAIGDEGTFRSVWHWTDVNLQRADRLLAWRWADGRVADWRAATDADLVATGALALAGARFDDPAFALEARRMSAAVLAHETIAAGQSRVLLAGTWARAERVLNPSYALVGMMSRLWWTVGDRGWAPIAESSRTILDGLTAAAPHLPPDWAALDPGGTSATARSSPGGEAPRYGYDAVRVLVQLAVDCNADGRAIAARPWPFLEGELERLDGRLASTYTMAGDVIDADTHAAGLVAAAAAAGAAGDGVAMGDLLDAAEAEDGAHPTYYGAAWVALGRLWLDTALIGGCRPGR